MKKFARKIKRSLHPLLIIPVLLVAGLIVAGILVLSSGDEGEQAAPRLGFAEGDPSRLPGQRRRAPKQAPVVRTGTLDEARRFGRLVAAQARGTIVGPSRVRIRVSAAPRQVVTVNWQLGCFKNRRAKVGRGTYRTRPPDTREVSLPISGAKSCITTASAQLTNPDRDGRIQVSVIAG